MFLVQVCSYLSFLFIQILHIERDMQVAAPIAYNIPLRVMHSWVHIAEPKKLHIWIPFAFSNVTDGLIYESQLSFLKGNIMNENLKKY
jgi:hypothetical protein